MNRLCLNCKSELQGRVDKKYCSEYCKSNFNYELNKNKAVSLFKSIDQQLKLNRRLLRDFNRAGKSTVRMEKIVAAGFNPKYFTHSGKIRRATFISFAMSLVFSSEQRTTSLNTSWWSGKTI